MAPATGKSTIKANTTATNSRIKSEANLTLRGQNHKHTAAAIAADNKSKTLPVRAASARTLSKAVTKKQFGNRILPKVAQNFNQNLERRQFFKARSCLKSKTSTFSDLGISLCESSTYTVLPTESYLHKNNFRSYFFTVK